MLVSFFDIFYSIKYLFDCRFTTTDKIGYRDININLEVGWTIESESDEILQFVNVDQFKKGGIRTHICEVSHITSTE